jgi:hypothetical protein
MGYNGYIFIHGVPVTAGALQLFVLGFNVCNGRYAAGKAIIAVATLPAYYFVGRFRFHGLASFLVKVQ